MVGTTMPRAPESRARPISGPIPGTRTSAAAPKATTALATDDRKIPTGRVEVAGSDLDFRAGREIGTTVLDTAYTDLDRDEDGRSSVVIRGERTVVVLVTPSVLAIDGTGLPVVRTSMPLGRCCPCGLINSSLPVERIVWIEPLWSDPEARQGMEDFQAGRYEDSIPRLLQAIRERLEDRRQVELGVLPRRRPRSPDRDYARIRRPP